MNGYGRTVLRPAFSALAVVYTLCCTTTPAQAKPSPKLKAALEVRMPWQQPRSDGLEGFVYRIRSALRTASGSASVRIGIEEPSGTRRLKQIPQLCAGTLRQQLDELRAQTGYTWQANGDWINLIPPGKEADPDYILNKRLPGELVLSAAPMGDAAFDDWLKQIRVSFPRTNFHMLRSTAGQPLTAPVIPGLAVLRNPTLREALNAYEQLHGSVGSTISVERRGTQGRGGGVYYVLYVIGTTESPQRADP